MKRDQPAVSPHSVGALPFAQTAEEVVLSLGSDPQTGLRGEEIEAARAKYGPNRLAEAPPEPWWRKIAAQFRELVIWILIVAAVISGAMGEWIDTAAIVAIVVLNAVIGYFQEERAQQALAALQKLSAPQAKTLRNGQLQVVPAEQLVVGDILELEAGDYIPADCRLLGGFDFTVQEAALTGESVPVEKDAAAILPATAPLGDRRNMAYLGTVAAAGKAKGVVVATGMRTELGRIAKLLERYQPETTPLERRLRELGRILIFVCLGIVGLIFALQTVRGSPLLESLLLAVSLAVAAVPEGLPAVVTMALALGLGRMVKRNVLVRKLPSVETLGCVTVVCSDKTGTLTRNEMTVREIVLDSGPLVVTGVGYAPHGEFRPRGEPVAIDSGSRDDLRRALTCGAWCNNARVVPQSDGVHWQVIGDPTEGALLVAARKAGIEPSRHAGEVLLEIPFDSTRKRMSVVVRGPDDSRTMYAKGAPEVLLPLAVAERTAAGERPLSDEARAEWLRRGGEMAERGLRVLALADRELPPGDAGLAEERLVLAGLVGITDPPREEVKVAIEQCRAAGIRPVMITGDHPATALAIGRELHLAEPGARALSGRELDDLSDEALVAQAPEIAVYARVTAEHKLRIVQAWKSRGEIVAMTGDGVNDAPAIKMADIGIAMGVTGTDVTKEAADMVLTDDNFTSIVSAVEEGRGIFDNIQKVLQFLLSCNLGEILLMLVASLLGWPAPLLPVQLLWINLVTDGLPALALSLEPPEPGVMRRPPRPTGESILSWRVSWSILVQGLLVGCVGLAAFALIHQQNPANIDDARAMTFCVLVYAELFRALASRSQTLTLWQLGLFSNPALLVAIVVSSLLQISVVLLPFTQSVFKVEAYPLADWLIVALLALAPVTILEVTKLIRARWWAHATRPADQKQA